jgi:hypothetical protein
MSRFAVQRSAMAYFRFEVPLASPLEKELERLQQELHDSKDLTNDLKRRLRDWYENVLHYWNFRIDTTICPKCKTRLDTQYAKGSHDDLETWTLRMTTRGPSLIYTCLPCGIEVDASLTHLS